MLSIKDLEVRAGINILLDLADKDLRIQAGDRVGLVGRNGAGKTTTMRILAGETSPYHGKVSNTGKIGYLPQDSKEGDTSILARDRILSARGLDKITNKMHDLSLIMENPDTPASKLEKAINDYANLEEKFERLGGYYADSAVATICNNLGLPEKTIMQPLSTLSGGQRRRIELAQILFSAAPEFGKSDTMLLLDEPTNHLDADSIKWLRNFLKNHEGGLLVISHDEQLLAEVVNKVWFLDANRQTVDVYNMGWDNYLETRTHEEERRKKELANATKKAEALITQAKKFGAIATKAAAAHSMIKRADKILSTVDEVRVEEKTAKIAFPKPAPCGKTPLAAESLTKYYGSLEIFSGISFAVDRGSKIVILGLNGAGKTTLLKVLAGIESVQKGEIIEGKGLKIGYFAQEHDTLQGDLSIWENMNLLAKGVDDQQIRNILGSFMFTADRYDQPTGTLSGGEKTRLALASIVSSSANVLLLDEPTNNLDVGSRQKVLEALSDYEGAVLLVTHDPDAAAALKPERVIVLPDGNEDYWSEEYQELISLA